MKKRNHHFGQKVRRDGVEPPEPKHLVYSQTRYPYGITPHVLAHFPRLEVSVAMPARIAPSVHGVKR